MTFAKMIQSNDALTKAMQICTVDLANGSCTPQQRYERDAGTVFVTGDGMEKRDLISYRNDYQILTEGSRSGLANCNYQSGEVGYLNAAADSFTPVADGFPTTRAGWECYYSLTGFADGWLVWVDECGCDETARATTRPASISAATASRQSWHSSAMCLARTCGISASWTLSRAACWPPTTPKPARYTTWTRTARPTPGR